MRCVTFLESEIKVRIQVSNNRTMQQWNNNSVSNETFLYLLKQVILVFLSGVISSFLIWQKRSNAPKTAFGNIGRLPTYPIALALRR